MNGNTLRLLSQLSNKATRVKREVPIQVCIGNPPYKDKAEGMGGWVESGFRSADVASPFWMTSVHRVWVGTSMC